MWNRGARWNRGAMCRSHPQGCDPLAAPGPAAGVASASEGARGGRPQDLCPLVGQGPGAGEASVSEGEEGGHPLGLLPQEAQAECQAAYENEGGGSLGLPPPAMLVSLDHWVAGEASYNPPLPQGACGGAGKEGAVWGGGALEGKAVGESRLLLPWGWGYTWGWTWAYPSRRTHRTRSGLHTEPPSLPGPGNQGSPHPLSLHCSVFAVCLPGLRNSSSLHPLNQHCSVLAVCLPGLKLLFPPPPHPMNQESSVPPGCPPASRPGC